MMNENTVIKICINLRGGDLLPSCAKRGSLEVKSRLEDSVKNGDYPFTITPCHCLGQCHAGPTIRLMPSGQYYLGVRPDDVPLFLDLLKKQDWQSMRQTWAEPEDRLGRKGGMK